jgi:regulator of sigma E protease
VDLLVSIAVAVVALGILIMLHEAGHFLVARFAGMRVRRFAIGFGPPLWATTHGETEYRIGVVPLGGYVQIDGMNPHDGTDPKAEQSFLQKPFHLKFFTILAGPVANYLIGYILFFLFFAFWYTEALAPIRVVRVVEGSPAAAAGLRANDLIVGTSSRTFDRATELIQEIQATGEKGLVLSVLRGDETLKVPLHPQPIAEGGFQIGVNYEGTKTRTLPKGVADGATAALDEVGKVSASLVALLSAPFHRGKRSGGEVSGPIGIVGAIAQRLRTSWAEALGLVAQISIGLGFMNLLPIPALDGSRLLFLLVGLARKKDISPNLEVVVHTVGLGLLLVLLLLLSVRDVGAMLQSP